MVTQKSRSALNSDIDSLFPDNTNGEVTPEDIRVFLKDLVESSMNWKDDYGTKIVTTHQQVVSLVNGGLNVVHPLAVKPFAIDVVDSSGFRVVLSGSWKQTAGSEAARVDLFHDANVANCVVTISAYKSVG